MNPLKIASLSALAAALVACDSGSDSGEVLTGTLVNVGGMAYTTPTQSGVTTLAGEYSYVSGENVTFHLGDIEFGTIAGREEIDLFDFFDEVHALPVSASEVRTQLRAFEGTRQRMRPKAYSGASQNIEYQYLGGTGSGIHLTTNKMRVLLAMDENQDLSNGLDLITGDWTNRLAGETLDFVMPIQEFADQTMGINIQLAQLAHRNELPIVMDWATPIASLYNDKGIQIDGRLATGYQSDLRDVTYTRNTNGRIVSEFNDRGTSSTETTVLFDENGLRTEYLYESDTNADGTPEQRNQYFYTFNDYGSETEEIYASYSGGDLVNPRNYRITTVNYLNDRTLIDNYYDFNDLDLDGTSDNGYYDWVEFGYDEDLHLITYSYNSRDIDGNIDTEDERGNADVQRDDQGRITSTEDLYQDGSDSGVLEETYTWNEDSLTYLFTWDEAVLDSLTYFFNDDGQVYYLEDDVDQEIEETTYINGRMDTYTRYGIGSEGIRQAYRLSWNEYGIERAEQATSVDAFETEFSVTYGNEGEWTVLDWGSEAYGFNFQDETDILEELIYDFYYIERGNFASEFYNIYY